MVLLLAMLKPNHNGGYIHHLVKNSEGYPFEFAFTDQEAGVVVGGIIRWVQYNKNLPGGRYAIWRPNDWIKFKGRSPVCRFKVKKPLLPIRYRHKKLVGW